MAIGILVAAGLWLAAQDPITGAAPPDLIKQLETQAVDIARANAGLAKLRNGDALPAATDRARFAIPARLETQTVRRGMLTGQLEYCGGDGVGRSFLPYMRALRASGRYSDRQLAYVGVLHGVSQQMIMGAMEDSGSRDEVCSQNLRSRMEKAAQSEPIATP